MTSLSWRRCTVDRSAAVTIPLDHESILDIVEFFPDATFVIDRDQKIIAWNRAIELMTGVNKEQMIGKGNHHHAVPFYGVPRPMLVDFICADDREISAHYSATERDGNNLFGEVYISSAFNGEGVYLWAKAAPLLDREGAIVGAIESIRDITELKRKEDALKESEERYRTLTENMIDGVGLIQEGRLLFVNSAFVSLFGHSRTDTLLGMPAVDLVHEDDKDNFAGLIRALENSMKSHGVFQCKCRAAHDSVRWIEWHNNVIKWVGKPAILTTTRDITDIILREKATLEETRRLKRENLQLKFSIKNRYRLGPIIGKSPAMQAVYQRIYKAALSNHHVIIYGESGTGKELAARAIHDMSSRYNSEFVPVNCGAIPENLLESEFFGHKKGAFTGAHMDKHGYLDLADGGSLFLDEIGELGLNIQVKLLRAIEGGGYNPLGSTTGKNSDIRIIAATNRNLSDRMRNGMMREDFYYRIHIIPITLPPLRERREDIPLLIEHFLKQHGNGTISSTIPGKIMDTLYHYDWPGNVRELQNVLHRYLTLRSLDFMSPGPEGPVHEIAHYQDDLVAGTYLSTAVENFEKKFILRTLAQNKWHRIKTASILGISRKTLFRKIKNFDIN